MISHLHRALALAVLLAGSALFGIACQKVPLLAPSGSTITLTAASTALPANGTTDIIAQVIEASGTPPHSGTRITFTTNLGTVQPSEAETDIGGRVVVKFLAGTGSGTATITAISGGVSASGTNAVKIAVGAAAVSAVVLSAAPPAVSATGGTSTITAKVTDTSGNPLPSVPVTFTTDNGSLSSSVSTSDSSGNATTVLTTTRTAKVTATAGIATSTPGTGTTTTTTGAPTATITVTVNATSSVTIGTASPATPAVNQTVSFPLTYPAGITGASPVARVSVDWGDGRSQSYTGQPSSISHSYTTAGSYLIVVTGIDSFGDTSTASTSITIGARPQPTVTISASPTAPAVGAVVTFTVTPAEPTGSTATIQSITVDFGDGQNVTLGVSTGATTVQHVYQTAGVYTATAIVRDSAGASGSGATTLVVGQRPQLAVTVTSSANPTPNTTTTFTIAATPSSGASINSITVDFGDGSQVTLQGNATSVSHVYSAPGTYTVLVTATDTAGASGSASTVVIVGGGGIVASFTLSPNPAKAVTQTVTANGSDSTSPSPITTYTFDFGDGSPTAVVSGSSSSATHTYALTGTYTVRLTIQDSAGRTATKTSPMTVN